MNIIKLIIFSLGIISLCGIVIMAMAMAYIYVIGRFKEPEEKKPDVYKMYEDDDQIQWGDFRP